MCAPAAASPQRVLRPARAVPLEHPTAAPARPPCAGCTSPAWGAARRASPPGWASCRAGRCSWPPAVDVEWWGWARWTFRVDGDERCLQGVVTVPPAQPGLGNSGRAQQRFHPTLPPTAPAAHAPRAPTAPRTRTCRNCLSRKGTRVSRPKAKGALLARSTSHWCSRVTRRTHSRWYSSAQVEGDGWGWWGQDVDVSSGELRRGGGGAGSGGAGQRGGTRATRLHPCAARAHAHASRLLAAWPLRQGQGPPHRHRPASRHPHPPGLGALWK